MGELLLGAIALVALIVLIRSFVGANPKALARALRYAGAIALGLLAVALFATDRIGGAIFVASAAWGLFTGGHVWPGGWPNYSFRGRGSSPSQSSTVRTDWLDMELDHDSGDMDGTVRQGAMASKHLKDLDEEELAAFYAESSTDPQTTRLLEAYLDRVHPNWRRVWFKTNQTPPQNTASTMSRAEAFKVLGLSVGASEEEIRAAHRKLMLQNHPDRGGSDYIAAKINEAKDVLLQT